MQEWKILRDEVDALSGAMQELHAAATANRERTGGTELEDSAVVWNADMLQLAESLQERFALFVRLMDHLAKRGLDADSATLELLQEIRSQIRSDANYLSERINTTSQAFRDFFESRVGPGYPGRD